MTTAQILSTLMSMGFAVAFTAQLRKLFTRPDGTCPIDGKWVYVAALVFGIGGKILARYAEVVPGVVWDVLEPLIVVVLSTGIVQAFKGKAVEPSVTNNSGITVPKIPPIVTGAIVLFVAGLALQAGGCWAAAPACKVVDAVHDTCVVFNYIDEHGQKQSISMNREEARAMAMQLAMKRAAPAASASAGAVK